MVARATQGFEKSAKAGAYGGAETTPKKVLRNPQRTHATILEAATEEFAAHGFGGARVDAIAARAQTNKRMLYHYFGDKEGLYLAVLEATYAAIRSAEKNLDLAHRDPEEGMRELALFTWHHFLDHPEFLSLLVTENLHEARYLKRSDKISAMHSHFIDELADVLRRGEAAGIFRPGIDPVSVYLTIAALGFFYLSNRHTLSTIFARKLTAPAALKAWGEHIVSVTLASIKAK
ncbi:TetR/AcrR family transcriptional regulator [Rhizobium jaguaris]|uniref:TetR/AcrR family transcriptional regulator n=1 Tax=Rhizobium jaguaris TaxID=1312183 RepID=A0A387FSF4_9HYPH|nr:TetR/AcrR family transcriptional regulator [Rhizobium jaguaris]AYG61589.1 TetR/AcrR family transcriptional regulator [Rhizobium jaguaris]